MINEKEEEEMETASSEMEKNVRVLMSLMS